MYTDKPRMHTHLDLKKNKLLKLLPLATAALVLSACTSKIGDLPKTVELDLPKTFQTGQEDKKNTNEAESTDADDNVIDVKNGWLNNFADADLNKHVQAALKNNPDLLASASRLKIAIEQTTIAGSSLWPQIRAGLNDRVTVSEGAGASTQLSLTNLDLATDLLSGGESENVTRRIRTVSATLDISWEADLWGKLTQQKRASAYNTKAEAELYQAAELSLVANVSRAWYNLVTNKLQVDLAKQQLESFKRTAGLIDENYQRGLRSALDVYLSRADVQFQISALSDARFNYVQSLRAFKTLLGDYPDTNLEFAAKLPELNDSVPTGLPAELLTRRPDIRASQLQYQAQIANAKVAYRERYPSINFSGSIGDSRDSFNELFDSNNMIMTLVSGITHPIFASGALYAQANQALYQAEQSYAALMRNTLTAFEEVENSLSRETLLKQQHKAIKDAVEFAKGGLDLALDRYQSGIEDYTTVLQSQRRLFDSMRTELNIRNALLQNRIGIHLSLGGDFAAVDNTGETNGSTDKKPAKNSIADIKKLDLPSVKKDD